jgi:hypothetical protein
MNPRERLLATAIVIAIVVAGGGFFFYRLFLVPLRDRDASIQMLHTEISQKHERIDLILAQRPLLERWRQMSLPSDIDQARRQYEVYLSKLGRDAGFAAGDFTVIPKPVADSKTSPNIPGKGPIYTKLTFTVIAHGTLDSLVQALTEFYRTGLLHEVKSLSIQRPMTARTAEQASYLDINMTVEALNVAGAGRRPELLPNVDMRYFVVDAMNVLQNGPISPVLAGWAAGPAGAAGPGRLASPIRDYADIASKNIFFGSDAVEVAQKKEEAVTRYVHLTDITHDAGSKRWEAFLYDRYNNRQTRLRVEAGFDSFRIIDDEGEVALRGKVVRMEPRELIFKSVTNNKYYSLHVGQNLEDAMKRSLSSEKIRSLGLVAAPVSNGVGQ